MRSHVATHGFAVGKAPVADLADSVLFHGLKNCLSLSLALSLEENK
jgi:hypothetical protein